MIQKSQQQLYVLIDGKANIQYYFTVVLGDECGDFLDKMVTLAIALVTKCLFGKF